MKAIVLLFTATLYSVCSAFPIVGDQQSNELCASLAYPQDAASVYVHLCNTPGKGNTRTHFCVLLYTQLYSQCVRRVCINFCHEPDLHARQSVILPFLLDYYCRYLHLGIPSKVFTIHPPECNCNECDTSQWAARGSILCYIVWTS